MGLLIFWAAIKDKGLFIGPQEFLVGYSKAHKQPQSIARHSSNNSSSVFDFSLFWLFALNTLEL